MNGGGMKKDGAKKMALALPILMDTIKADLWMGGGAGGPLHRQWRCAVFFSNRRDSCFIHSR